MRPEKTTLARQRGLTLVELMIVIVVIAILLAIAMPSFRDTIDKRRLVGAADNLLADLRYAQSESIKRNAQVVVAFTEGANWSYVINTTPAKTTNGSDYKGSSITVATTGDTITFDPRRGTILQAPGSEATLVTITSALGASVGLAVDPLSRMRLCSSSGVGGYPACP